MRIKELPQSRGGLLVKIAYWFSRRRYGKILDPLKVMSHHFWVLLSTIAFEMALERAKTVDKRLKELVQLKAAVMAGCPW